MNFLERSLPLIQLGLPVTCLKLHGKHPLPGYSAKVNTTDTYYVRLWAQANPDANVGVCATSEGFWFLDIDDESVIGQILTETEQPELPKTFTVKTSRGRHLYFRQNDASKANGNVPVAGKFEARSDNYYVVGPGSIHPSGSVYTVIDDAPITEAPAWLTSWIASYARTRLEPREIVADRKAVQETVNWLKPRLEAASVPILGSPSLLEGGLKICVPCPNAGQHTSDSGPTEAVIMILADGSLAYKCHHAHCSDFSWAWFRDAAKLDDALMAASLAKLGMTVEMVESVTPPQVKKENWRFPEDSMYGPLGELAASFGSPLGLAYPAVLTVFAGRGVPGGWGVRPTLYTALLSNIGKGKSYSMDRALEALQQKGEQVTISSDRGLGKAIGDRSGGDVLIHQDEMLALMEKAKIQGSTLATELCKLWNKNEAGVADKKGADLVNASISILGGVAVKERYDFRHVFSRTTSYGLYDRMLFGCPDKGQRSVYQPPPYPESPLAHRAAMPVRVDPSWFHWAEEWRDQVAREDNQDYERFAQNLLRIAYISASAAGESSMTEPCFLAAQALMNWQRKVRAYFKPGTATNANAEIAEWVEETLLERAGASLHGEALHEQCRKKLGLVASDVGREIRALVSQGRVQWKEAGNLYWMTAKQAAQ